MEVWIGRDGERLGPYKEEDVRQWLRSGQLARDDLGWYEGLSDWQPLAVLFADALPATPPPFAPLPAAPLSTATAGLEDYAGFWKRVVAYIIDAIVLYIPNLLVMDAFGGQAADTAMQQAVLAGSGDPHLVLAAQAHYFHVMLPALLLSSLIAWLYFALCESSAWQATLGKRAVGIRVTDLAGRRIGLPRALGRYLAKLLSFAILFVGVMMVGWTRRKQGLHDMLADTLVLNGRADGNTRRPGRDAGGSFSA